MDNPKSIAEEAGLDPERWHPIDVAPIIPAQSQHQNSSATEAPFVGSLPPGIQQNTDFSATARNSGRGANLSLMPFAPSGVAGVNSAIQSTTNIIAGGSSIELDTNGTLNPNQSRLNLVGSGVSITNTSDGTTTITSTATGDGLTHGDAVWEHDSAYVELRDDFVPFFATTFGPTLPNSPVGELGWLLQGNAVNLTQSGGNPPYIGQLAWDNGNNADLALSLLLNYGATAAGLAPSAFHRNSFALLENPGWKMTWIFKQDGSANSTGDFQTAKKAFYIGLSGAPVLNTANVSAIPRPDIFIGLRFDTSATPGSLTLSSVANASGGNTVYTGTITGGANGAYIGMTFVVAGFLNGVNNGTFLCVQSTVTTLTLANAIGVTETHAGTATASGLNDTFYTFEAVANPQYTTAARHNKQGQTFITNISPTMGTWHRLDMTCSTTGIVTLILDGSSTNTVTFTVPQVSYTAIGGQASCNAHEGRVLVDTIGTSGTAFVPPFTSGSIIIVSGLTAGNVALNGTWTLFYGDGSTLRWDAPVVANIVNNPTGFTLVGYPALTPICTYGNDNNASPVGQSMRNFIDYFSLVWNPNLRASGGTPDVTKARYW